MRTLLLAAAFFFGAVLAGCSKPEPASGAPTPDVVAVDSAAVPDSAAAAGDSTKPSIDSTLNAAKDSTAATSPDSAAKP